MLLFAKKKIGRQLSCAPPSKPIGRRRLKDRLNRTNVRLVLNKDKLTENGNINGLRQCEIGETGRCEIV